MLRTLGVDFMTRDTVLYCSFDGLMVNQSGKLVISFRAFKYDHSKVDSPLMTESVDIAIQKNGRLAHGLYQSIRPWQIRDDRRSRRRRARA
tara:strand:- start:128 stop:400 length:273 start_codon:yes stop_codon:yes gene_type:complete